MPAADYDGVAARGRTVRAFIRPSQAYESEGADKKHHRANIRHKADAEADRLGIRATRAIANDLEGLAELWIWLKPRLQRLNAPHAAVAPLFIKQLTDRMFAMEHAARLKEARDRK